MNRPSRTSEGHDALQTNEGELLLIMENPGSLQVGILLTTERKADDLSSPLQNLVALSRLHGRPSSPPSERPSQRVQETNILAA